jgi:two-component system CheB/CheR fusion protein
MAEKKKTNTTTKKTAAAKKKPLSKAVKKRPVSKVEQTKAMDLTNRSSGFYIVGMGASAGGLEAFEKFFQHVPENPGVAFVLVPHLDLTHVSIMPDLLRKYSEMEVLAIKDGITVEPDTVYVVPPNKDLGILNGTLQLIDPVAVRGKRLPIDFFFHSLAQDQRDKAVCVILSGTGTDGTKGLKAIKDELGMAMVQDPDSAKYDGMPVSAVQTGLVDYILPPEEMPEQLVKYTGYAEKRVTPGTTPCGREDR